MPYNRKPNYSKIRAAAKILARAKKYRRPARKWWGKLRVVSQHRRAPPSVGRRRYRQPKPSLMRHVIGWR